MAGAWRAPSRQDAGRPPVDPRLQRRYWFETAAAAPIDQHVNVNSVNHPGDSSTKFANILVFYGFGQGTVSPYKRFGATWQCAGFDGDCPPLGKR